MEGASASSHHDPVSPGADTTLNDATEDDVVIVEGEAATSSKRKADQRPLVGSPFDIALFRELQSEMDNPFMESKRELKNRAWDELATRLHRVKTVTCKGSFWEITWDVKIQRKVRVANVLVIQITVAVA